MKKIIFLLVLALIALPAFCESKNDVASLNVSGSGSVLVEPDCASIELGVEVSRKTAEEAQAENARLMRNIISAVKKLGVPEDKTQTSGFSIWPEIKYEKDQVQRIIAYRCRNTLSVTVEDLKLISKVIDRGIGAGANNVQGLSLFMKNDAAVKKAALEKAVNDALSKANTIAAAAKVKIKHIINITETTAGTILPFSSATGARLMAMDAGAETPVASGQIEIRAAVQISYKIE
jgi:hypothetical protein